MQPKHTVLLTICTFFLISFTAFSQENELVLYTHNLGKFYVYVNNQLIERSPQNQVTLSPAYTKVIPLKIVFQNHDLAPFETTIKIKNNKKSVFVIYSKKGSITVSPYQKVHLGQYLPGFVNGSYPTPKTYTGRLGCDYPVSSSVLAPTIYQLSLEKNTVAQETIALDLIKNHCLTVRQLQEILTPVSDEKSRIDLAQYAWPYIYDQENYTQLADFFENEDTLENILIFVHTNQ